MAEVKSKLRSFIKPVLFKILGKRGYFHMQVYGKVKDIKGQLLEEPETHLLPEFVKAGDEVLDIGANYAYYSNHLNRLVGTNGKVYAFEPVPFTFKVAQKVIKRFKMDRVTLYNKGVGDKNGQVEFEIPLQDFGMISAGLAHFGGRNNELKDKEKFYPFDKHEVVNCEVIRIDDFLLNKLSNLTFIKCDIEGGEYFAFKGLEQTVAKFRPVILVEIQPFFLEGFKLTEAQILDQIEGMGYDLYRYEPKHDKLVFFDRPMVDSNYLLLPKEKVDQFRHLIAEVSMA